MIPTPGWLEELTFEKDKVTGLSRELTFCDNDGKIAYGYFDDDGNQISGFAWVLKDDGTYDKFSVEYVKIEKEKKNDNCDSQEGSSNEEEDGRELLTFICNEK